MLILIQLQKKLDDLEIEYEKLKIEAETSEAAIRAEHTEKVSGHYL